MSIIFCLRQMGKTEAVFLNSEVSIWIYFFLAGSCFLCKHQDVPSYQPPYPYLWPLMSCDKRSLCTRWKEPSHFFKGVFHFANLHLYTTLLGATSEMDRTQTTEKIHLQATVLDPDNPSLCSLAFLLFQAVFGAHYDIVVDCYLDFRVLWQGSVITRVFFAAITCLLGLFSKTDTCSFKRVLDRRCKRLLPAKYGIPSSLKKEIVMIWSNWSVLTLLNFQSMSITSLNCFQLSLLSWWWICIKNLWAIWGFF